MKQPHRLGDGFRVPRPVRSGRSENARPGPLVVVLVAVSLALLVIILAVEVSRIITEGAPR